VRSSLEPAATAPLAAELVGAEPVGVAAGAGVAASLPLAHEELVLEGPPGADFEPVNRVLREHLPSGWSLRVVGAGGAHGR